MKITKFKSVTSNTLVGILMASIVIFGFTSCARKAVFVNSSVVPAAKGYIKVKRDNNNNYVIHLNISNLAEVSNLKTSKQTYVVWMLTNQEKTENIGQLTSSSGFLSKKLSASFKTISSAKPVKIFITAENDGTAQNPDGQFVLTTNIF
jgi:hypothetical protein